MKRIIIFLQILFLLQVNCYAVYYKIADFQTSGYVISLDIKGDYVYTTKNSGLMEIINISDPEQPQLTGSIQLYDWIDGIIVSDTMAFILYYDSILFVNVADPFTPVYTGSIYVLKPSDIIIRNNIAYIASYFNLYIYDISDIQAPQLLGTLGSKFDGICINDSLLYGVKSGCPNSLSVISVSNPENPVVIGGGINLSIGSYADIEFSDFYLYIVNSRDLWSIDVHDPVNPVVVDTLKDVQSANGIYIQDDIAFISHLTSGVRVVDISDPYTLSTLGYFDTPGGCWQAVPKDNTVYVADSYSGLQIFDIADNSNSYMVSTLQTSYMAKAIGARDDFAYIAKYGYYGLDVIDISDVNEPLLTGSYFGQIGRADNISILNNHLCLSREYPQPKVLFIDISIPSNPTLLNQVDLIYSTLNGPIAVFQTTSYAFVGTADTLNIFDISDFSNPVLVAKYTTTDQITDIVVEGYTCYVSVGENGIEIIDLESISSPQFIGSYDTPGNAVKMTLQSDKLIVADGNGGIQILDVSNPLSPQLLESIKPHNNSTINAKPLIVDNKLIIVDMEWNELFTYSIADFNNIQLLSSFRINVEINDLIYHNESFIGTMSYYGMTILVSSAILSVDENEASNKPQSNLKIYPNPFKSSTIISFNLHEKSFVNIEVYSQTGMKVKDLINEFKETGSHNVIWDGTDMSNNAIKSGTYIVRIRYGKENVVRKVLLMR